MCSCPKNTICPLDGKCLTKSVIYNAEIVVTGRKNLNRYETKKLRILEEENRKKNEIFKPKEKEFYTGLTKNTIKDRIYKHHYDCNHREFEKRTALSKYIWKLKDNFYNYKINWRILSIAKAYNPATKSCNLCTKEKYYIIFKPNLATLNENNELLKKCRHRYNWIIENN